MRFSAAASQSHLIIGAVAECLVMHFDPETRHRLQEACSHFGFGSYHAGFAFRCLVDMTRDQKEPVRVPQIAVAILCALYDSVSALDASSVRSKVLGQTLDFFAVSLADLCIAFQTTAISPDAADSFSKEMKHQEQHVLIATACFEKYSIWCSRMKMLELLRVLGWDLFLIVKNSIDLDWDTSNDDAMKQVHAVLIASFRFVGEVWTVPGIQDGETVGWAFVLDASDQNCIEDANRCYSQLVVPLLQLVFQDYTQLYRVQEALGCTVAHIVSYLQSLLVPKQHTFVSPQTAFQPVRESKAQQEHRMREWNQICRFCTALLQEQTAHLYSKGTSVLPYADWRMIHRQRWQGNNGWAGSNPNILLRRAQCFVWLMRLPHNPTDSILAAAAAQGRIQLEKHLIDFCAEEKEIWGYRSVLFERMVNTLFQSLCRNESSLHWTHHPAFQQALIFVSVYIILKAYCSTMQTNAYLFYHFDALPSHVARLIGPLLKSSKALEQHCGTLLQELEQSVLLHDVWAYNGDLRDILRDHGMIQQREQDLVQIDSLEGPNSIVIQYLFRRIKQVVQQLLTCLFDEADLNIDELQRERILSTFDHVLHHCTYLFIEAHAMSVALCCVYAIQRISVAQCPTFKHIIHSYLAKVSPDSTPIYNLPVSGRDYGNLIQFYNLKFISPMRSFVLRFDQSPGSTSTAASPTPSKSKAVFSSPVRSKRAIGMFKSPMRTPGTREKLRHIVLTPKTSRLYAVGSSPSKALRQLNHDLCLPKK